MRSLRLASFLRVARERTSSEPYATCSSEVASWNVVSMAFILNGGHSYNKFYFREHPIQFSYESRADAIVPCRRPHRQLHRRIEVAAHQPAHDHDAGEGARRGLWRRALLPAGPRRAAHRKRAHSLRDDPE